MPELPEVESVRRTLDPLLTENCIETFTLLWPRTLAMGDIDGFRHHLVGQRVDGVSRRGKLLVLRLSTGDWVTVHLRMTGELLYRAPDAPPRVAEREPYLRAVFGFIDGAELLFYDTRKFGRIAYYQKEAIPQLDASIGVEPLGDGFTTTELGRILRSRRRLKSLLLDQRLIAGLGNIYVDEALFTAQIHPLRPASDLTETQIVALQQAIVAVLSSAVDARGTTLRDYRSGLGEAGTNQHRLQVYGKRPGSPCPRCGTPLARIVVDQRSTMFCPNCQTPPHVKRTPSR